MKFQLGNKLGGRKKGSKNKASKTLRDNISLFLESEFEEVRACFYQLSPGARMKLYLELMPYALPKLQAMSLEFGFEKFSDDQLSGIIETLIEKQDEHKQITYTSN